MARGECWQNPPEVDPAAGQGCLADDLGGLKAYTAGSPDSNRAILLVSDPFGYEVPTLRKLADNVAAVGFYVVVPDFFRGEAYAPECNPQISTAAWLQNHSAVCCDSFFPFWSECLQLFELSTLQIHATVSLHQNFLDKTFEDAKAVIEALKNKGISAVGAAGFCWSAKVVVQLAKTDCIEAAVMVHPSYVTVDDIKDVKCDFSILGAEVDHVSPPELMRQFEEILSAKSEVNSFVKIYPGVAHGWAVRYDVNDEQAVKRAKEAQEDMIGWFIQHVN